VSEPAWTPDSRHVAVIAAGSLYNLAVDGSGTRHIIRSNIRGQVGSWTPAGRGLVVTESRVPHSGVSAGIVLITTGDNSTVEELLGQSASQPALSHDGNWLTYVSTETGQAEVYLRRFPGGQRQWRVSTAGGTEPRWRSDGRELFYRRGREVIAVSIHTQGTEVAVGKPTVLFESAYVTLPGFRMWDVAPSGQAFIMVEGQEFHESFITVRNWLSEVSSRVGR
jgi:Tol biopolymer transport system component